MATVFLEGSEHLFFCINPLAPSLEGIWQLTRDQNIIGVSLQNIQSDPDTWVEPRIFHPERILPKTDLKYEQHLDKDNEHSFQSFSAGH